MIKRMHIKNLLAAQLSPLLINHIKALCKYFWVNPNFGQM